MLVNFDLPESEVVRLQKYADEEEFGNRSIVIKKAIRNFFAQIDKQKEATKKEEQNHAD